VRAWLGIGVGLAGWLAAGGAHAVDAVPATTSAPAVNVTALVCPEVPGDSSVGATLSQPLAAGVAALQQQGVMFVPSFAEDGCRRARAGQTPPEPDLVVTVAVGAGPGIERSPALIAFRVVGHDISLKILGRALTGSFASHALRVPGLGWSDPATGDAPRAMDAAANGPLWPDLVFGVAGALAYRKISAREPRSDALTAQAAAIRGMTGATLARVDREWLSEAAPLTAAVVKQMRAMLLFDEACPSESPRDILRAAARLSPYSAQSQLLVGLARFNEMHVAPLCAVVVRDELLASLALDPWNDEAVDDLGVIYELALDAEPEPHSSGKVSADEAAVQLEKVWQKEAPPAPMALEMGFAASVTSSVEQSLRDFGPGARVELAYGRDGSGLGVRVGLAASSTRQLTVNLDSSQPLVTWTRPTLDIGPRYRRRFGSFYGEIEPAFVAGLATATGHGFTGADYSERGVNLGASGTLRVGRRLGRMSVWIGASASYFFGKSSLQLMALQQTRVAQLPQRDLSLLAGASVLLWR